YGLAAQRSGASRPEETTPTPTGGKTMEPGVGRGLASTVRSQPVLTHCCFFEVLAMRTRVPLSSRLVAALVIAMCGHASLATAQTSMVPYFGKNNVHYDKFVWSIYTTDHFEIYYYPQLEQHLERIA